MSLGAHDVKKIDGNVTLRLTDGGERFVPLGKDEPEPIAAGDYCYVDDSGDVLCRLEYRQADKTKVMLSSDTCFYIVQGNENTPDDYTMNAAEHLIDLTKRYCGGKERIVWT